LGTFIEGDTVEEMIRICFCRQRQFRSTAIVSSQVCLTSRPSLIARKHHYNTSSLLLNDNQVYLHIGPSGDCWTASSLFAAKHLQPDYVKSIPLDSHVCPETLVEYLEENTILLQKIYDLGVLPPEILESVSQKKDEKNENEKMNLKKLR
jgi:hypothetical protein